MVNLINYSDFYEGFLKGMEDIYTLFWKNDSQMYSLPSMAHWDYDILTNLYSVGYYKGYAYFQDILLNSDEKYICLQEAINLAIRDNFLESIGYVLKRKCC